MKRLARAYFEHHSVSNLSNINSACFLTADSGGDRIGVKEGLMDRFMRIMAFFLMGVFLISAARGAETKDVYKATVDSSGVQKIEMVGGSYYFRPNDIIVKVNVPVEISIKKEPGATPHDIVLRAPEAGIDFKVELSTDPKIIKFTPTKVGKYPFYCDHRFLFWTHRAKGMEGVLEVVE
jgi:plastocyanin